MKHVTLLIIGMLLLVLGAQGAIRLLADHDNAGLLAWLPGGFAVWLACYAVAAVAGALLAGRGGKKAKRGDREQ
ncbi:hypothetical protein [Streptosporangium roseum]|uniref:Uncharacterized protein n=1 Tax=Streptosporangium roseum (strain ATCC 12428 / DSM 43021 / JCM 3005 / KCTC 9067 / NCIMB 10171 / NRRL 2505 / NI 9100) TaxID=479432 RepID=D2BAJ0_STRRD|nr:hypothetical protein [Streptosporangium roseum]ACZ89820.1 hypothetical protein Sros_7125 [Streptosporangium roseum DSM 43021]